MFRKKTAKLLNFNSQPSEVYDNLSDDIVTWTTQVRKIKGKPFSFAKRKYLESIYRDINSEINIVKPRQMEITEFALNWLLFYLTKNPFATGLYMSDRQDHVSVFSKLRLQSEAIEQSEYLKHMAGNYDHNVTEQPFINGSRLYMYSAWGDFEAARSIPVDFAVVDEMQSVNVEALPVLKESLSKSRYRKILKIGTGSDEGDEWWKEWHRGTQHEWNQQLQIWEPKSLLTPGISSYHITQYMASWIRPEEIEYKHATYTPRRFANEIDGWWYKGARKPLTNPEMRFLFDRSLTLLPPNEVDYTLGDLYMGVDWGGGINAYTIPWIWQCLDDKVPRFRLIYVQKIEERSTEKQAEMIGKLLDAYHIKQGVMDVGGAPYQVQKIEERYAERMIKCSYMSRPENPFEIISEENRISVDRTWTIESIIDLITRPETNPAITNGVPRICIPAKNLEWVEWIIDHFTCIEAESVILSSGKKYVRYIHPQESNDDALHACNYAYLAWLIQRRERWEWISI